MKYMIDLETLSVRPDAAILQIGIASFDLYSIKDSRQWNIEADGRVDTATLDWWMRQIDAGVQPPGVEHPRQLVDVLNEVCHFMPYHKDNEVWANPSTFDIVILGEAFHRCNMKAPWDFRQARDLRTLRMLYPDVPRPKPDLPHVAVYDAIAQAEWVMRMLERHEISVTGPTLGGER